MSSRSRSIASPLAPETGGTPLTWIDLDRRAVDAIRVLAMDAVERSGSRGAADDLAALGIAYDDVVAVLEDEGIEKFQVSWEQLLENVRGELGRLGAPCR